MIFFRKAVDSKKVMRPKQPSKLRPKKSTLDFVSPSPSCGLTFSYWNVNGLNFQAAWAIEQALTEKVLGCKPPNNEDNKGPAGIVSEKLSFYY